MTATGASGQGILASGGSVVNATGANVSGASGGDDVEVSEGGIVAFASGTGTVNQTVNSPTGAGIIFNPAITKKGTWTPVVRFSTLGDLSVTYARQYGVWWREGDLFWFAFEVAWTHTHSTSSGPLQINGLPVHPATFATVIHPGITFSRISRVVFGASDKQLMAEVIPATNKISLQVARDGTTMGSATTSHFPSSGGEFLLGGHGSYRTA